MIHFEISFINIENKMKRSSIQLLIPSQTPDLLQAPLDQDSCPYIEITVHPHNPKFVLSLSERGLEKPTPTSIIAHCKHLGSQGEKFLANNCSMYASF